MANKQRKAMVRLLLVVGLVSARRVEVHSAGTCCINHPGVGRIVACPVIAIFTKIDGGDRFIEQAWSAKREFTVIWKAPAVHDHVGRNSLSCFHEIGDIQVICEVVLEALNTAPGQR